ncbi:PepSY domain-containing protein [Novosphingobium sp. P6W]|uniref:PepSY-associated TM helix domain-containing protein n=1 Tax=Novosphingobium sp. P6W TaxID=1609758 RepID=UPI0005C2B159|nr:PepSY-associated TM helix domain-containing protein [Novosphingobium sp. P6W]AXB78355.1 PepSY domain-containing protein [Novosphingobium sp. P6W]KIS32307.1 membrane protein [Novosphingobium sp. P6W]
MIEKATPNTRAKQWRWPISPETVRSVLSSHSVLGLAFAAVIYLVCLTGTVAVMAPDLERWEVPATPIAATLSDAAAARAIADGARHTPSDATLYLNLPSPAMEGATLVAYSPTFERKWSVSQDGRLAPLEAAWTEFLIHLHVNLHLPRSWGEFIVGLTGVALLSSLVSGILAHPRVLRDAFHLRLGGSRRLQEADLHNRLGIWALPFHFTLALTGALLGLSTVIVAVLALLLYRGDMGKVYELFLDPPPPVNAGAAPLPDIAALIARARAHSPKAQPQSVIVARPGRADMRISVHGRRSKLLVQQDETHFDAKGRAVSDEHPEDIVAGTRILGGIGQLHFGWFAGLPVRIAYALLGIALCIVTSSGVTIWLARRRDRGRAAPQWERIWATVCWGQPVILALTALASSLAPAIPLPMTWLGLTVLSILASALARRVEGPRLSRMWRWAFATVLIGLGLLRGAPALAQGGYLLIDGLMLAGGAGLLVALVRGRAGLKTKAPGRT